LIEGLRSQGVECFIIKEDFSGSLDEVLDSDLLVAFRVGASDSVRYILEQFKQRDIPLVFDVDDLVFEPESAALLHGLSALGDADRMLAIKDISRLRDTLLLCDFATCTTSALAKRVELLDKRCFVIPNSINKKQIELAGEVKHSKKIADNAKVRIGYFSGTRTHDRDFQEVSDSLYQVMGKNPGVEFHLVGILDLPLQFDRFKDRIFRQPLMDYLGMLSYLETMDINLAPLELHNIFTACKSELKIFEAAIMGVPTVASATDSYASCITDGINGFLAVSKGEWVEKLDLLIHDEALRHRVAEQAENDFVKRFSITAVTDCAIDSYKKILDFHKSSVERNENIGK
jgi:glycosyltransferase involved in cell wall biosynthesis